MRIHVFASSRDASEVASRVAARLIRETISLNASARIAVSTGNSQLRFIGTLVNEPDVDWSAVEAFHLDEYAGIHPTHPASFRLWLRKNLADRVPLSAMQYIDGNAPDLDEECRRYGALVRERPIDVGFVGIGENGHIAFNDPPVADFEDTAAMKIVELDPACRRQQVGEGHFPDITAVPDRALTMTCPTLFGIRRLICCVPDLRKAEAVQRTIEGPISTACPASILRTHPDTQLFLDRESASLLHT
jgi:glucosamine-6-phosphate deaminase